MAKEYTKDSTRTAILVDGYRDYAYVEEAQEVLRSSVIKPLYYKKAVIKIPYSCYLTISDAIISSLMNKTSNTYHRLINDRKINLMQEDYILTEDYYKYITWFDYKTKLEFEKNITRQPAIIKGGVYYVEIGENIGSELHKLRPALIYKKCVSQTNPNDSSYIIIPLTSKLTSSKYSQNYQLMINGIINIVRLNDMRRVSIKRIVSPLIDKTTNQHIILSSSDFGNIKQKVKEYFVDSIK